MAHHRVLSYGVSQVRASGDEIDHHIEELDYRGYTVVDSGLDDDELTRVGGALERACQQQLAETKDAAAEMAADADVLRCALAYDDIFLRVATVPPLLEICRRVLGANFVLLQQNGLINRPGAKEYQSRWHRDLPYQHFVASKKLALNALLCVDPFTAETGGTYLLPGSHMFEEFPTDRYIAKHEKAAHAKAGSILVLDAMLFHRAGYNVSGRNRRGVNHLIGRPLMVQQIDVPRLLEGRYSDDSFLQGYLGYRWNPATSVGAWRQRRAQPTA